MVGATAAAKKTKAPKQLDWKRTGWEERIIDGDEKDAEKVWKEIWSRYGAEFKFRSGRGLTKEWFTETVTAIRRRAEKKSGKPVARVPAKKPEQQAPKANESSKRTVPSTAKYAPRPEAAASEFGSIALDRDMCYKVGNLVYTLDDLTREKNKDGWVPVFLYKEGMDKNVILFMRPNTDPPGPPLVAFATQAEPQVLAKELINSVKESNSIQDSLTNIVDYLLEEKEVPNVDRTDLMNGVLRTAHKILMVLLQQGQIRPSNKK